MSPDAGGTDRGDGGGVEPRDPGTDPRSSRAIVIPRLTVKPPEGRLTVDERSRLEVNLLTYRALANVAAEVATNVRGALTAKDEAAPKDKEAPRDKAGNQSASLFVVTCACEDLQFLAPAILISNQITELLSAYRRSGLQDRADQTPAAKRLEAVPMMAAALGVLNTALDVATLFRVDTQIQGQVLTVHPAAVVATLAAALKKCGITLLSAETAALRDASLVDDLSSLGVLRDKAVQEIANLKREQTGGDRVALLEALNNAEAKTRAALDNILLSADRLTQLRMVATCRLLKDRAGALLAFSVVAAGGSNITRRSLFTTRLEHTGGCVATWLLIDSRGVICGSGVEDDVKRGRTKDGFSIITDPSGPRRTG